MPADSGFSRFTLLKERRACVNGSTSHNAYLPGAVLAYHCRNTKATLPSRAGGTQFTNHSRGRRGAGWARRYRFVSTEIYAGRPISALPHHGRAMVMNHQPLIADAFEEIGGEHAGFNRLVVLTAGQVLGADDPA